MVTFFGLKRPLVAEDDIKLLPAIDKAFITSKSLKIDDIYLWSMEEKAMIAPSNGVISGLKRLMP